MASRVVPDLFLAVACSVLNKAMEMSSDWWWLNYVFALIVCGVTYKEYPLVDTRAGVISCLYTFVFVLFPYSSSDWKKFGEEGQCWVLLWAFLFGIVQFVTVWATLKPMKTDAIVQESASDKAIRERLDELLSRIPTTQRTPPNGTATQQG